MSEQVWVRHPDLGVTQQVPESAVRVMVRSGWQALDEEQTAAHLQDLAEARAARVASLTPPDTDPPAESPAVETPAVEPVQVTPEKAPARAAKSKNEES